MQSLRSAILLLGAVYVLLVPPVASAHVLRPADTTLVQDLGQYRLSMTMSIANPPPSPMSVQVVPERSFSGVVAITLWLVPAGGSLPKPPPAHVISAQGTVTTQFPVSDPG